MAILMEEGSGRKSPFKVLAVVALLVLLGAATYYLFFAPAPFIEVIIPSGLQSVSQISEKRIDTLGIFNSPVYKSLKQYTADPIPGEMGRTNPFGSFTQAPR